MNGWMGAGLAISDILWPCLKPKKIPGLFRGSGLTSKTACVRFPIVFNLNIYAFKNRIPCMLNANSTKEILMKTFQETKKFIKIHRFTLLFKYFKYFFSTEMDCPFSLFHQCAESFLIIRIDYDCYYQFYRLHYHFRILWLSLLSLTLFYWYLCTSTQGFSD